MGRPRTCECGTCAKCVHRDYMREWYQKTRRSYAKPDLRREYERTRYHTDPDYRARKRARGWTMVRLMRGTMTRGDCVFCGQPQAEAHHRDYTQPADVTWLCRPHHQVIHSSLPST